MDGNGSLNGLNLAKRGDCAHRVFHRTPRFDDRLEEIIQELKEKYHPGICERHPDQHCFHHRTSNNHFILDRTKLIVWASKIVSYICM